MSGHIRGELLAIYRDLGADERARVDAHAAGCRACAQRLARLQAVDAQVQQLADIATPLRLLRPLPVVMQQRMTHVSPSGWQPVFVRLLGPAAVGLLVIVALWLALSSGDRTHSVATATPTYTLTPTATMVTQMPDAQGHGGKIARSVPQARPVSAAFAPLPVPLPAPGHKTSGALHPASLFFVALEPRATIMR